MYWTTNYNDISNDVLKMLTDFSTTAFKNEKYPYTNIFIENEQIIFEMALAGYSKDDIEISIENNVLKIEKHKNEKDNEITDRKYLQRNITNKYFTKSFLLSDEIDTDSIKAEMVNGILKIVFDKKQRVITKIEIQ